MHGYYRDTKVLQHLLSEGYDQSRLKMRNGDIIQGEVASLSFSGREIGIEFAWICQRTAGTIPRLVKWTKLESMNKVVTFHFAYYYTQRARDQAESKPARKSRIKLKKFWLTLHGEECWFYKEGDPEYLIRNEWGQYIQNKPTFCLLTTA